MLKVELLWSCDFVDWRRPIRALFFSQFQFFFPVWNEIWFVVNCQTAVLCLFSVLHGINALQFKYMLLWCAEKKEKQADNWLSLCQVAFFSPGSRCSMVCSLFSVVLCPSETLKRLWRWTIAHHSVLHFFLFHTPEHPLRPALRSSNCWPSMKTLYSWRRHESGR